MKIWQKWTARDIEVAVTTAILSFVASFMLLISLLFYARYLDDQYRKSQNSSSEPALVQPAPIAPVSAPAPESPESPPAPESRKPCGDYRVAPCVKDQYDTDEPYHL